MVATLRILLMLGLMVLLTLIAGSCGSKKKTTQRERTKTEKVVKETFATNEIKAIKDSDFTNIGNTKLSIKKNQTITATQADSSKTITITDPKGNVTKIKGANVVIRDLSELERSNDTLVNNSLKVDNSVIESSQKKDNTDKSESQKRDSDVDIKRTGIVAQITIGVLIVAILVFAYYKRTSIFNWFKSR